MGPAMLYILYARKLQSAGLLGGCCSLGFGVVGNLLMYRGWRQGTGETGKAKGLSPSHREMGEDGVCSTCSQIYHFALGNLLLAFARSLVRGSCNVDQGSSHSPPKLAAHQHEVLPHRPLSSHPFVTNPTSKRPVPGTMYLLWLGIHGPPEQSKSARQLPIALVAYSLPPTLSLVFSPPPILQTHTILPNPSQGLRARTREKSKLPSSEPTMPVTRTH